MSKINETTPFPLQPKEYDDLCRRFSSLENKIEVLRHQTFEDHRTGKLTLRYSDLSEDDQAVVLDLDPIADREEFYAFREIVKRLARTRYGLGEIFEAVGNSYDDHMRNLGLRLVNLRVTDSAVWSGERDRSVVDILEEGPEQWRCLVVDLGSVPSMTEKMVVTSAILGDLWRKKDEHRAMLVVMDEAHYFCPPEAISKRQARVLEDMVTIAGEGRKYNIFLTVASQRPAKIHQNILSQCENLFLMKMNSQVDLDILGEVFSFVPRSFVDAAGSFKQGDVLIGGKVVKNPTFARFGRRILEEGGADPRKTWLT